MEDKMDIQMGDLVSSRETGTGRVKDIENGRMLIVVDHGELHIGGEFGCHMQPEFFEKWVPETDVFLMMSSWEENQTEGV
jgi:hypothetical protein